MESIVKLRTAELRKHREQCPELPISQLTVQELKESITNNLECDDQEETCTLKEASCKHMALMAISVKQSTMNYQSSQDSRDFDVTSESESELEDSEAESHSSNQPFKNWVRSLDLDTSVPSQDEDSKDSKQDTSGSCNEDDSYNDEPERPHPQIQRKGSKKRRFVFPKPSKKSRSAACARIKEALDQVPYSVHLNSR